MRDLVVSQIHLKEVQSSGVFYVKGKERDGLFCKTSSPSRIPLMISMSKGAISLKALGMMQA